MKAQDLMTAPVVTVAPDAPVPEIATLLSSVRSAPCRPGKPAARPRHLPAFAGRA
ncbi:MAG: hypothetical protein ACJ8DT_16185 [Microvirga sp.]